MMFLEITRLLFGLYYNTTFDLMPQLKIRQTMQRHEGNNNKLNAVLNATQNGQ